MKEEIIEIVKKKAKFYGLPIANLLAFIEVETGGIGFDTKTGKILIQFEPKWFKRKAPYAPSGKWSVNKVDVQSKEWLAFNDAFTKNPNAAMESTSIGLGQIMGFHYKRLNYDNVGAMWDDAKTGLEAQVFQIIMFIMTDLRLKNCMILSDWDGMAKLYNGYGYKELALSLGREPYDRSLLKAYNKYKSI